MIEHYPKEEKPQDFEERCIQNLQAQHHQDSAAYSSPDHQCLDAAAVISPPGGPAISDREADAPDVLANPAEPSRMVPSLSEDEPEENKEGEEIQGEPPPDPVKEGNVCEQQEGLNTKQVQSSPQHHHVCSVSRRQSAESLCCCASVTFKQEESPLL